MRELSITATWFVCGVALSIYGCHKEDPIQKRLEHTVAELRTRGSEQEWMIARREAQIAGLQEAIRSGLHGPRILYAARLPHKNSGFTFVVDYVDERPQTSFFRVYGRSGRFVDLVETESSRKLNLSGNRESALYSAVWVFDSADAPEFGREEEAYVEIHNQDGTISPRVQIRMLPFLGRPSSGTTTRGVESGAWARKRPAIEGQGLN